MVVCLLNDSDYSSFVQLDGRASHAMHILARESHRHESHYNAAVALESHAEVVAVHGGVDAVADANPRVDTPRNIVCASHGVGALESSIMQSCTESSASNYQSYRTQRT